MTDGLLGLSIKRHLVPEYDLWTEAIFWSKSLNLLLTIYRFDYNNKYNNTIIFSIITNMLAYHTERLFIVITVNSHT